MANTMTSQLILALVDRVTAPARKVQGTMARLNDRIEQNKRAVRQARGEVIGATAGLAAFGLALAGPVRSAMQLESALADVAKVADFDPAGLEEFKDELQAMARRVPLAVTELAALAAEAAAASIATEDLARFTERAQVGVAFGMTGEQAGMAMAKLRTGLDMTVDEVFSLADTMNFLSNSQASNADQLTSFMLATGADAKSYGFAAEEADRGPLPNSRERRAQRARDEPEIQQPLRMRELHWLALAPTWVSANGSSGSSALRADTAEPRAGSGSGVAATA